MALGVPEAVAQTYVHLLEAGPVKVSALAAAMGTSRDDTYRRLSHLAAEGFAAATLTRPMMYVPAQPADVFQILHRQSIRLSNAVRQAQRELEPLLQEFRHVANPVDHGMPFRVVNGRERIYDNLHEMLDGAMTEMLVLSSHPAAAQLAAQAGLWRRISQRAGVGLRVRLLMQDTPAVRRHAARLASAPSCEVRFLQFDNAVNFSIADGHRMIFFASRDPAPWMGAASDCALVTTAPGFVEAQKTLFWYLWGKAGGLSPDPTAEAAW